jgi:hypothetical protein
VCYKSRVPMNFLRAFWSIPPPSGSATSIHRAAAIVCLTSLALIQTLPFVPTATSRGKRDPSRGRRK